MLIVNDNHLCLAGVASLAEKCCYCSRPLAAYPLIMSDDTKQAVYHVTCALELATDILVDLSTLFSPPVPYPQLFVLTAPEAVSRSMPHSERGKMKESHMQSTNMRLIKAAIWDQAFLGSERVSCTIGAAVAVRRRKGQLVAMIRGWGGRWYLVDSVRIEHAGRTLLS